MALSLDRPLPVHDPLFLRLRRRTILHRRLSLHGGRQRCGAYWPNYRAGRRGDRAGL